MNKPRTSSQTTFGFISVREIEGLGHCGGLLIVSQIGRPVEFHCSAPVVTNRAQKILYGETYETYLFCEQIGLALIDKAKSTPSVYVANCGPLSALSAMIDEPVVVLGGEVNNEYFSHLTESQTGGGPQVFEMGEQPLWSSATDDAGRGLKKVQTIMGMFTKSLPLNEPFERIEKAIEEAQAVAK